MLIDYSVPLMVRYDTVEALDRAFTQGVADAVGVPVEELESEDYTEAIRAMGLWGYTDTNNGTVHYWWSGEDDSRLLEFLAHELGHYVTNHPATSVQEDAPEYEVVADRYAWVAVTVARMLREVHDHA